MERILFLLGLVFVWWLSRVFFERIVGQRQDQKSPEFYSGLSTAFYACVSLMKGCWYFQLLQNANGQNYQNRYIDYYEKALQNYNRVEKETAIHSGCKAKLLGRFDSFNNED